MLLIVSSSYTFLYAANLLLQVFRIDVPAIQREGSFLRVVNGVALLVSAGSGMYVARLLGRRIQQAEDDEVKEHRRGIERQAEELVRARSLGEKEPKPL